MTRHVIKIDASSFKDVRSGRQTCLIHRNDRLWNPGDEIWFAECDGDPLILNRDGRPYCYSAGGQFTGSVIRQLIIFTHLADGRRRWEGSGPDTRMPTRETPAIYCCTAAGKDAHTRAKPEAAERPVTARRFCPSGRACTHKSTTLIDVRSWG